MKLKEFFVQNPKVAIAFSGGVDSSYLLYEAINNNAEVKAYYVKSAFQPQFELEDAKRLAEQLNADLTIIEANVFSDSNVTKNPANRCYFCKRAIFETITNKASEDGYKILLDGTNFSDDATDRPGMKALKELSVLSPLRICELTKDEIRFKSKEAGLFTWNKPAYACLATRIKTGEEITLDKLRATEKAENLLFSLGFTDFRVRMIGTMAKLQFPANQLERAVKNRKVITYNLKEYYTSVVLDMEARDE